MSSFVRYALSRAGTAPQRITLSHIRFISSVPAGTNLNLNIKKSGKEVVALEDEEYPEWLWTLLDEEVQKKELEADFLRSRRKAVKKMNNATIKQNNFLLQK